MPTPPARADARSERPVSRTSPGWSPQLPLEADPALLFLAAAVLFLLVAARFTKRALAPIDALVQAAAAALIAALATAAALAFVIAAALAR
jgi:hypothetical protein